MLLLHYLEKAAASGACISGTRTGRILQLNNHLADVVTRNNPRCVQVTIGHCYIPRNEQRACIKWGIIAVRREIMLHDDQRTMPQ